MTHTDTTQRTSVGAMKPAEQQWPGTPAEWDAERDRRARKIKDAIATVDAGEHTFVAMAIATMPPRPVEPPSVVTASGWRVTWDGERFVVTSGLRVNHYKDEAEVAYVFAINREKLDAIRALRDGPTARYEVCGWGVWKGDGAVVWWSSAKFGDRCEQNAREEALNHGGTAHAIYKRVGGA